MFGLRKMIGTILLLVVFVILTLLATFLYNSDQKQKEEVASIGSGAAILNYFGLANWGDRGAETTTAENINPEVTPAIDSEANSASSTSFWSRFSGLVKKEWADSQKEISSSGEILGETSLIPSEQKFFEYQKTGEGAEITFRVKSGAEYKLPLPFKFLNKF